MNNSTILRGMTRDGSARVLVTETTAIVNRAIDCQKTSPTASAALGRVLTAASLMGCMLPEPDDSITLSFRGNGPAGRILAVGDYYGCVKGYVENPDADAPNKPNGKLDVSGIVGEGTLSVVKDVGNEEPTQSTVPLVSGEIAEDIASYFATSEQTPTLCALGVLIGTDRRCMAAGGVMIQLLPFADEAIIEKLEANAGKLSNLSALFAEGKTTKDVADLALEGIEYDLFDEIDTEYACNCSRERMQRALISLGRHEVEDILSARKENGEAEEIELSCQFCGRHETFDRAQINEIFGEERK